jgi:hypothetical protein
MHVHARIEGLRVHARIPKLGILCTCLLVSRDERSLHLLALTVGRVVRLPSFACTSAERSSVCGSRAEHLLALFKSCAVYLYSVSCAES